MKIKFKGPSFVVRRVGELVWNAANQHEVEISDLALCANLLTSNDEFGLAHSEPLLQVAKENDIAAMAMQGIGSLEMLAQLNSAGISALADLSGRSEKRINAWVTQAQKLTEVKNV